MEYNFVLTDLMLTGFNPSLNKFLSYQTLERQQIQCDEQYYALNLYDFKKYQRKFFCLFTKFKLYYTNNEYCGELKKRIDKLTSLGFKLIICDPWESKANTLQRLNTLHIENIDYTFWSGNESWFWFMLYEQYKDKKFNFDHCYKPYTFFYLNKNPRDHRLKLFDCLKNNNLLENSLYSFTRKGIKLKKEYELPWVDQENYPDMGHDQDIYELPYNHSAYNIVSETHVHEEKFITEKIWKPIIAQQIFVVHGRQHYLKDLKDLGFKTFDGVIDESYDQESDPEKRINKIVDLCRWLKNQDWKVLYEKTKDIREHNARHFFNKEALQNVINKTVLGFLKFADRS
jgi:hypothetical protein